MQATGLVAARKDINKFHVGGRAGQKSGQRGRGRQQEEEKEAEPSNLLIAGKTKLQQGHLNQSENCYQSPSARKVDHFCKNLRV